MYDLFGYSNDDTTQRYSNLSAGIVEWYHTLASNELSFGIACALIIALMVVIAERQKQAIAHELITMGNWCRGFFRSAWLVLATRGRDKAMRKKLQEEFAQRIQTVLLHMIDTAVEKGGVTQTMANAELKKLARAYPELRHAIWKPADTKEAVVERRKNEERDVHGKIIPLPLP